MNAVHVDLWKNRNGSSSHSYGDSVIHGSVPLIRKLDVEGNWYFHKLAAFPPANSWVFVAASLEVTISSYSFPGRYLSTGRLACCETSRRQRVGFHPEIITSNSPSESFFFFSFIKKKKRYEECKKSFIKIRITILSNKIIFSYISASFLSIIMEMTEVSRLPIVIIVST